MVRLHGKSLQQANAPTDKAKPVTKLSSHACLAVQLTPGNFLMEARMYIGIGTVLVIILLIYLL